MLPVITIWMDLEFLMLSKISQSEKGKYFINLLTCFVKKTKQRNKQTEPKQTHRYREQTNGCQRERSEVLGEISEGD